MSGSAQKEQAIVHVSHYEATAPLHGMGALTTQRHLTKQLHRYKATAPLRRSREWGDTTTAPLHGMGALTTQRHRYEATAPL